MKLNKVFANGLVHIEDINKHYENRIITEFQKCENNLDSFGQDLVLKYSSSARMKMETVMDYLWLHVDINNKSSHKQYEMVNRVYNRYNTEFGNVTHNIWRKRSESYMGGN